MRILAGIGKAIAIGIAIAVGFATVVVLALLVFTTFSVAYYAYTIDGSGQLAAIVWAIFWTALFWGLLAAIIYAA